MSGDWGAVDGAWGGPPGATKDSGRERGGLIKPDREARKRPTDPEVPGGETGKELAGVK